VKLLLPAGFGMAGKIILEAIIDTIIMSSDFSLKSMGFWFV
jgi:hypothetical protein